MTRIPFGVSRFDSIVGGGAPPGNVVLLSGEAGAGAREFLYTSAAMNALAHADEELFRLHYGDLDSEAEVPPEVHYLSFTAGEEHLAREMSYTMDTEITEVLVPTDDVIVGRELAYAPSMQMNGRARYEWSVLDDKTAFVQGQIVYSSESRSDIIEINAAEVGAYSTVGLRTGLQADRYSVEFFVENLTDQNYELANNFVNDRERVTVGRPRTWGVRVGVSY